MKLSCADFTFPLLPHDIALRLIRLLGFEAVDLGVFMGRAHLHPEEIATDVTGAVKRIKDALASHDLLASDVFVQLQDANHPEASVRVANRQMFRHLCEFSAAIGCAHMTGLPGNWHGDVDVESDWQLASEEAHWRMEAAAKVGVIYGIEAHVGSICPDPGSALRFLRDGGDLTLTLDYGHFIRQGFSNESVHPLLAHASHLHARGGCPGQLQSQIKPNAIDFTEIVLRLHATEYTGWICLEYVWTEWENCNRTDNISETILLREQLNALVNVSPTND